MQGPRILLIWAQEQDKNLLGDAVGEADVGGVVQDHDAEVE